MVGETKKMEPWISRIARITIGKDLTANRRIYSNSIYLITVGHPPVLYRDQPKNKIATKSAMSIRYALGFFSLLSLTEGL